MNQRETPLISKELLKLLVCPVSGGRLELVHYYREMNKSQEMHIMLYCRKSNLLYPIEDGIPVLIPNIAIVADADMFCKKSTI